LVSELDSINQVISFYFLYFCFLSSASIFLCVGSDLVSNQFRSDCRLPTLFLISCIELSLLELRLSREKEKGFKSLFKEE
jgi:hypothetical protein